MMIKLIWILQSSRKPCFFLLPTQSMKQIEIFFMQIKIFNVWIKIWNQIWEKILGNCKRLNEKKRTNYNFHHIYHVMKHNDNGFKYVVQCNAYHSIGFELEALHFNWFYSFRLLHSTQWYQFHVCVCKSSAVAVILFCLIVNRIVFASHLNDSHFLLNGLNKRTNEEKKQNNIYELMGMSSIINECLITLSHG